MTDGKGFSAACSAPSHVTNLRYDGAGGTLMTRNKYWLPLLVLLLFGCARMESTKPIYDEKADAHRDVSGAIPNAERTKKNIVLIFGANW
jgi:hypothetical protein